MTNYQRPITRMIKNKQIQFQDLGPMDYQQCWDYQSELLNATAAQKLKNRNIQRALDKEETVEETIKQTPNHLLLVEHPPVYTLGKSGSMDNVLLSQEALKEQGIQFYKINRGGDITYHGPGQIVGYPILDLDNFFTDIHRYLRTLEEVIMLTMADYGLKGERLEGSTGVWLDVDNPFKVRKICAMGIRCSRWITMHGWAFNVNTDLSYFNNIIPCGITDKSVTSLHKELGKESVDISEVKQKLLLHFEQLFEAELVY